ncbi:hypothetical protein GGI12_000829 [Dipsacomyces acuminosporus]|nr:hypothetical protein GGI12_000829 [Dipsacomyces acuminosporus]
MEAANKLARRAADKESDHAWDEAAELHRQAAEAYRNITEFDFDPVATLTISSLSNKHARWAEFCERESKRKQSSDTDAREPTSDESMRSKTSDSAKDATTAVADKDSPDNMATAVAAEAAAADNSSSAQDEREFEDFWQYMQNWLANPAAFTRPTVPSGSRGAGNSDLDAKASTHSVMESFYFVGPNPEQSSSIYAPAAATPKTTSPLQTLDEADEDGLDSQAGIAGTSVQEHASTAQSDGNNPAKPDVSTAALLEENQKLRELVMHLREQIRTLESAAYENSMLKSSILNFREEFHRHANVVSLPRIHEHAPTPRRTMAPHSPLSPLIAEASASNATVAANVQLQQLESRLQELQIENTKQKAQIARYRDRWEKLKDSAKKKRQQQLQQQQQQQ